MDASRLVFLISQPRSGSTMLQLMLQQSGKIACPPEPWIALPLCGLASGLTASPLFPTHDGLNAVSDYLRRTSIGTFAHYARDCLLHAYEALPNGKDCLLLDKTPPYHRILPWLETIFPEAKFIILRRHPLAVLHSCANRWHGNDVRAAIRERYDDLVLAPLRLSRLAPIPGRRHILFYKSLVAHPEKEMAALCDFLGLPHFAGMGSYKPSDEQLSGSAGDRYSTPNHTRPQSLILEAWQRSPNLEDLLQAAAKYFPQEFWTDAQYPTPVAPAGEPQGFPTLTVLNLPEPGALEINSTAPDHTRPAFPNEWNFTPQDPQDHVATKPIPISPDWDNRLLIDLDLHAAGQSGRRDGASGLVRIQNQKFETLFQSKWPLDVMGLSVPITRERELKSLRFVFSGQVGIPLPLPTAIGIQTGSNT